MSEITFQNLTSPRSRAPIVLSDEDDLGNNNLIIGASTRDQISSQMQSYQNQSECVQRERIVVSESRTAISPGPGPSTSSRARATSPSPFTTHSAPNSGRRVVKSVGSSGRSYSGDLSLSGSHHRRPLTPRSKSHEETTSVGEVRKYIRQVSEGK